MTKFALSEGIIGVDGNIVDCKYFATTTAYGGVFLGPNEWAPTLEAAQTQAEEKRARKIASLHKRISDLRLLSFSPEP